MGKIRVEDEFTPGRGGECDGVGRRVTRIIWPEGSDHISSQEAFRQGVNGPVVKWPWQAFIIDSNKMEKACPDHARICDEVVKEFRKKREEEEQD